MEKKGGEQNHKTTAQRVGGWCGGACEVPQYGLWREGGEGVVGVSASDGRSGFGGGGWVGVVGVPAAPRPPPPPPPPRGATTHRPLLGWP